MTKIALDIETLNAERSELGDFLARPDAYNAPDFTAKNKRFSELETLIAKATERQQLTSNLAEAKELANGGDELAELAKIEITETEARLAELEEELFILLTPKDPNDEKNIIMEIRAGAGGDSRQGAAAKCVVTGDGDGVNQGLQIVVVVRHRFVHGLGSVGFGIVAEVVGFVVYDADEAV